MINPLSIYTGVSLLPIVEEPNLKYSVPSIFLPTNILALFEDNARLGMLGTSFPNHGEYFELYGNEWTMNFENTKKLAEELGIHVPMDGRKMPITGYGSVFWFRADALKKLYKKEWQYEDFPEEPLADNAL